MSYAVQLELLGHLERLEEIYVKINFFFKHRNLREIIVDDFFHVVQELTQFWESEAGMPIFPRRMAAWLSDYLQDLGYAQFSFEYILDAINKLLSDRDTLAMLLKMLGNVDPDVKPSTRRLDIELPNSGVGEFLANEIDNQIEEVPTVIGSQIIFIDEEGEVSSIKAEQEIVKAGEASDSKKELKTSTSFSNPTGTTLKNVQINNIVPYGYKVMDTKVLGFEDIQPRKKLLDEGLQLTWILPELEGGQETKIEVDLERRVARTIVVNMRSVVDVIQTYFNIVPAEDKFTANDAFININTSDIDHLVFEDEIPFTFNLIEVNPVDDDFVLNPEKTGFENLVKWRYSSIPPEKKISHFYSLLDHLFYLVNSYEMDAPVSLVKIIEPNIMFNELVVSYYIKIDDGISRIYIEETIPEDARIVYMKPWHLDRTIEAVEDKLHQLWRVEVDPGTREIQFGYVISGVKSVEDFPTKLHVDDQKTYRAGEIGVRKENYFFITPDIHVHLRGFKRKQSFKF
ncbi:MAG: hypothetical protein ACTSUE_08335 [Promethearchaeota archaeon]